MLTPQPVTEPTNEEKTLAVIAQLAPLAGYLGGFFWQIIIPLVILLVKRKESCFVKEHAQESLNFQISMLIYYFFVVIIFILLLATWSESVFGLVMVFLSLFVLFVLPFVLFIFGLVTMILASVKAYKGKLYRYPFCLRLINL
ncbi:MAG: DUF4870 domain-containing protein [Cyanobacteriota bacterium]